MKFNKIEEIEVWKLSIQLTKQIYVLTNSIKGLWYDYSLKEQIRKSVVSIASNIAEGFERETNLEFIRFLYIAKASCGELRTQIFILYQLTYISENRHKEINLICKKISGMLMNLIKTLKYPKSKPSNLKSF